MPDRDITDYEWAMQYVDSNKKVVLVTTRNKGSGQIGKECPFMYGRLLRLDYEDPNSTSLILLVDCSKGIPKMYVSEDHLVKDACGPESFRFAIESSDNLITTLHPYIQGHKYERSLTVTTKTSTKEGCQSVKANKEEGDEDVRVGGL